jgi:ribosomal-protein-alanine N-acetyltransferase
MIGKLVRLFRRTEPSIAEARPSDAATFAALHAECFRRGWTDGEFEGLLLDRSVLAHRATIRSTLVGFILSRLVAGEAEILSVGVAAARRNQSVARKLLETHLRRLVALGARAVFLEVDEKNTPARRLYRRAGFREVGRRPGYYAGAGATPSHALLLRRDLA